MLTTIYYSLAIIAYSIFLIQFIISIAGGSDLDMDIDIDGDGFSDFSWSDIFSFKGIIHFLMGFAGWLSLVAYNGGTITWFDYLVAIIFGLIFFVILFYTGILMLKLKHEPSGQTTKDFIGCAAIITIICSDEKDAYYVSIPEFGGQELKVYSLNFKDMDKKEYKLGDNVTIVSVDKNGKFYID